MKLLKLLAQLAELNPQQLNVAGPRRTALRRLAQAGTAVLPAVLTVLPQPVVARDVPTVLDVLKLGLTLSQLENELYSRALGLSNADAFLGTAENKAAIQTMQLHEQQHIALFTRLIQNSGGTLDAVPRFDFTGSKNGTQATLFPDVFTNFDTFLKVAQLLEDAGVRAYKGQVEYIQYDNYLLETALRVHSTEARHSSHIRTMRRQRGATVKSWVSPSDTPLGAAGTIAATAYAGEESSVQYLANNNPVPFTDSLPINVATPPLSQAAILAKVAEAFDEPITAQAAGTILGQFIY
ncbi:Ferritin-like domain-containing protein [Hymenobacter gelipurpurascens]|uniref:Ferritin-like domain-containing protein n=1 Tax=Hymenobacter gelipurpurascens TaxID=89968 RepID=A0A212UAZ2_9BACT|nr:ferritin-like domain-containing protein [Hymenobacter gelipurpurascens]SNC75366.1 Ferritin-like domain-containing protein [Hymenobacter gelipurpurascens]